MGHRNCHWCSKRFKVEAYFFGLFEMDDKFCSTKCYHEFLDSENKFRVEEEDYFEDDEEDDEDEDVQKELKKLKKSFKTLTKELKKKEKVINEIKENKSSNSTNTEKVTSKL